MFAQYGIALMNDSSFEARSSINTRLETLKAAYRQRLINDLEQIREHVGTLNADPSNIHSLGALHRALHKLAGSAGTFGFEQLGSQAQTLERQVAMQLTLEGDSHVNEKKGESLAETWSLPDCFERLQTALQADESRNTAVSVETISAEEKEAHSHIWLLERDPMLADYISQQLRSFGFNVLHLSDAQYLDQGNRNPPDLLLVDHRASESPGLTADPDTFWRNRLAGFACPVIFTGAEESFTARLHAVRSGGCGYFAKPLDVPQLAAHVARILKATDSTPERVLIVEDDAELAQHCQKALEQAGMLVKWLDHPRELIQTVSDFRPELVLMDLWLPEATGAEMVALLTQVERWAHLPIVYLSAQPNPQLRAQALIMGGDAFLEKPVDPGLLVSLCRNRVRRLRDLEQAMTRDGLTGLIKHASIKEALQTEWEYVRRHPRPFSVIMLDIDHFKAVNDSYGHAVGDLVIAAVGTLLRQHFRSTDKLGRYGGEEFALVLPDCAAEPAERLVNGLREAFAAIQFMGDGQRFSCTLSAGVVDNQLFPNDSPEALIKRADLALYQAKHGGRNRVCRAQDSNGPTGHEMSKGTS
jgi:diguanylate cyclase (GGDEF)-like protein